MKVVTEPSSAFLMVTPDPLMVDRIVRLSGLDPDGVNRATLLRFGGGLPFRFDGFDPRRRHTFRQVVAQGWFPSFGTQVCSRCLADDGIWQLQWRLPLVAACRRHRVFLTTHCAGCGQRFRTHRHAPLRPVAGPAQPCGNPVGLRNPCRHPVVEHTPEAAPPAVIDTTTTIVQALAGQSVPLLGSSCDPRVFLAEIRHLATLLLHLLSRPDRPLVAWWASDLRLEAARRTTSRRGPRWGISPPESAVVRGHVLAEAHRILNQPGTGEAASLLVPWLDCITDVANVPRVWLVNRTTRTATMERLIRAATSRRHHVGRRLSTIGGNRALRPSAIPQLMDSDIYREFFAAMLGGYEWTGRLYSSLCVLRSVTSVPNWSEAAAAIGLDPDLGVRTARAASARMRVSPTAFTDAVDHVSSLLPPAGTIAIARPASGRWPRSPTPGSTRGGHRCLRRGDPRRCPTPSPGCGAKSPRATRRQPGVAKPACAGTEGVLPRVS